MKAASVAVAAAIAVGSACAVSAQEMQVQQRSSGTMLAFDVQGPYKNVTLSVAGPKGYNAKASIEKGNPRLNLGKDLPDGVYTYQLSAATDSPADIIPSGLDNGRGEGADKTLPLEAVSASGSFIVRNGSIVSPQELAGEKEQ